MKFGHKIGLSFLALTLLTAVTGSIGLVFVNRVLSVLGSVSDNEGPLVRNLEDLNRYLIRAVAISRNISADLEVEDLVRLRKDFNSVAQELERTFQDLRREIADEIGLGTIEELSTDQRQLKDRTQSLISAITDELTVENQLNDQLASSQSAWRRLVGVLGVEVLATPGSLGRLQALSQVQHGLMLLRLELNEFFTLEDADALVQADLRVRSLFARSTASVRTLHAFPEEDELKGSLSEIEAAFVTWRDSFVRSGAALEGYRRKIELKQRTDELSEKIQVETRDTLRVLDSMESLHARLVTPEDGRGFVTAAPYLLILTVVATTLLSALLGIFLTMNITKPVRGLIVAAEAVGSGDYSRRLRVDSGDELAQLGGSFNRMIVEIDRSQEKIRALNVGLEQRVRERTGELEQEVRERRNAELSLRESEDRYRTLIESFPSGIIALIGRSLRLIALGGDGIRRFGALPEDLVGRSVEELFPPDRAADVRARFEAAFADDAQSFDYSAGGTQWQVSIVRNPSVRHDRPETATVLALDVTEARRTAEQIKQKQAQLVQAEKLASLGVLVAGMAHEINNPNQAIMMGGQLMQKLWPDIRKVLDGYFAREGDFLVGGTAYTELRETLGEHVQGIVSSAARIESIVTSLKGFARQDHTDMSQLVNLNVVVRSALILLSSVVKKATDYLEVNLSTQLPAFRGNVQQIEQVVINLTQNACQALEHRRQSIILSTSADEQGRGVVLEVSDEGGGIAPEQLPRIMDPFFTTKRDSGGTGLGLSVSATIVNEHGGILEFFSKPGRGTTARVWFPAKEHTERSLP